ncbi:hypothetical protein H9Y05_04805 [Crocinitomicaceae bacterium CZZ-1]|uniref:Outer membrane protein beta-barrel domain-containing protein n=1 Tax=Taishania pollutisoli TaxID=2766479 RepID=A0A8J6P850_9FLAO|nr:hypothetical protein [Taishania pollutisoli]MBC9811791.1 hypothetical protein [Taishania pollutisoli]MBX2948274.1 hypothetical protein [Crocinitomicaceae bacterium]NGF75372.1 hypothetical protein [Fluviicola sp. SGL-29]
MVRAVKNTLLASFLLAAGTVSAQFSLGGGPSFMFEFGNGKPFYGLHFNVEIPRNNEVTFYGRATYLFNQNKAEYIGDLAAIAKDANTDPQWVNVSLENVTSIGYFMIDGGTRYYLINGFDEGFSLYGGTNLALIVNSVKYGNRFGEYDKEKYTLDMTQYPEGREKGTIIRLAVGFTGGIKYTIPAFGSFYLDFNPQLTLFGIPSTQGIPSSVYKPVFFNFNIGYRRELY